jgi:hypothetical protein
VTDVSAAPWTFPFVAGPFVAMVVKVVLDERRKMRLEKQREAIEAARARVKPSRSSLGPRLVGSGSLAGSTRRAGRGGSIPGPDR